MKNLTFITGNANKAKYLSEYFDLPIKHKKIDLPEIQSLNLQEIVESKAKAAYKIVRKPVMVEDVSLTFTALNNMPGPLIKWFLESLGNDELSALVKKYSDYSAVAEIIYCIFDGKELKTFHGQAKGSIAKRPKGNTQFGWDPIFIPDGYTKTWAEMTTEEKDKTSMRKKALIKVRKYLLKK